MADPFVLNLNHTIQDYASDPKNNPFSSVSTNPEVDKIIQSLPSLAVGSALTGLGKSQYGPFGSYLINTLGPNLNNIYEAFTPVSSPNDSPAGRRQFYMNYVAGLYNPNSPYNVSYSDVGNILQDALSGSSDTEFSNNLRTGDATAQVQQISDFIKGFGATTMSSTKVNMMQTQLYNMFSDYVNRGLNGSLDPGSTSFVNYLVSRSADFLDRFFGQKGWAALSEKDFTDPQASNSPVQSSNVPPPTVPANGAIR